MSNLLSNSLQEGEHNLQEMKTKSPEWSSKGYHMYGIYNFFFFYLLYFIVFLVQIYEQTLITVSHVSVYYFVYRNLYVLVGL